MSTSPNVRLAQLYAVRAQIDALILAEEAAVAPPEPVGCPHPIERRQNVTTMGGPPKFLCMVCQATVEGSHEG